MLGLVEKQPVEILDYDVDFRRWLVDDTISAASVEITPAGELMLNTVDTDTTAVKLWLRGGISGTSYKVEVTIETDRGRRGQVEFRIRVKDK
jgi:hypothetical protein